MKVLLSSEYYTQLNVNVEHMNSEYNILGYYFEKKELRGDVQTSDDVRNGGVAPFCTACTADCHKTIHSRTRIFHIQFFLYYILNAVRKRFGNILPLLLARATAGK